MNVFLGASCLSCKPVKELAFVNWGVEGGSCRSVCVIGVCEFCSNGEDSVSNAMVGSRWRAS